MASGEIRIGELCLIPHRSLRRGERALPIGGRALAVLTELAEAGGEVVGKDRLIERVWGGAVVEDNALQAQVSQLRKLLGDEAARLSVVHGRGYRLTLDGGSRVPSSLAVLPFANLTGDPAMDYLGEGMAEELLVILSRAPKIKVSSRTSSFAYRGRDADVREIARDLGVDAVLEGSVRVAGERIRVTAQLIEADSGFHLWSQNYDRRLGDLLVLQDEIAQAIVSALRAQLGLEPVRTPDFEAYHLYLRARSLCESHREADLRVALGLLDEAVARDPAFARAFAQRGYCIYLGTIHGFFEARWQGRVVDDAASALALEPDDPATHALHALVRASAGDWCDAREAYLHSFSLDGSDPRPRADYGYAVLAPLGRAEEALAQSQAARLAAPADPGIAAMEALLPWMLRGDFAASAPALDRAFALGVGADDLVLTYTRALQTLLTGDVAAAVAMTVAATPPDWQKAGMAPIIDRVLHALLFQADRVTAAQDLKAVLDHARTVDRFDNSMLLTAFGLSWLACLDALDDAYDVANWIVESLRHTGQFHPPVVTSIWMPLMRPFREDPRFDGFVRALGMFDYWERYGPPDGYRLAGGVLVAD